MAPQRENWAKVSGHKVSEFTNLVRVSHTTIYSIKKHVDDDEDINRRLGSSQKTVVNCDSLRDAIWSSPRTSMRQHARRLGVGVATVQRAVAKLGAKFRVIVERPLLMPAIHAKHFERCQTLVNNFKSASAVRVIIFSDEKTWTFDPVRNRRTNHYLSLFGRGWECLLHFVETETSSICHVAWFCCALL